MAAPLQFFDVAAHVIDAHLVERAHQGPRGWEDSVLTTGRTGATRKLAL